MDQLLHDRQAFIILDTVVRDLCRVELLNSHSDFSVLTSFNQNVTNKHFFLLVLAAKEHLNSNNGIDPGLATRNAVDFIMAQFGEKQAAKERDGWRQLCYYLLDDTCPEDCVRFLILHARMSSLGKEPGNSYGHSAGKPNQEAVAAVIDKLNSTMEGNSFWNERKNVLQGNLIEKCDENRKGGSSLYTQQRMEQPQRSVDNTCTSIDQQRVDDLNKELIAIMTAPYIMDENWVTAVARPPTGREPLKSIDQNQGLSFAPQFQAPSLEATRTTVGHCTRENIPPPYHQDWAQNTTNAEVCNNDGFNVENPLTCNPYYQGSFGHQAYYPFAAEDKYNNIEHPPHHPPSAQILVNSDFTQQSNLFTPHSQRPQVLIPFSSECIPAGAQVNSRSASYAQQWQPPQRMEHPTAGSMSTNIAYSAHSAANDGFFPQGEYI